MGDKPNPSLEEFEEDSARFSRDIDGLLCLSAESSRVINLGLLGEFTGDRGGVSSLKYDYFAFNSY